ncbi:AbrB family transcriptional regulator [Falsiroseomonas sp. CW058]|uniref:AbrB family transcriptional regulator n=1 Tax=Falsiroseomonas sp. CW058 TaxID=3388664 RepID=UPI003D322DED
MLLTAAVAMAGGALFWWLRIPLPWMLGPMMATGLLAWFDRATVPAATRPTALLVLGLGLGQTFTRPVIEALGLALPWLVLGAVLSVAAGIVLARPFARFAGTDPKTGYFAAVPGGVVVMAVLAQRAGVSVPAVTLAQTIRVMTVVVVVPPLITWLAPHGGAGAFLVERPEVVLPGLALLVPAGLAVALAMRALDFANPWMLGPCAMVILLSAFGLLPSGVPLWMIDAAQIGMGASLGQRMTRRFILSARRLVVASAVTTVLLSALLALLAAGLAGLAGLPAAAAILGMAPGGMPEMTITAKALEVGVPLVLGFHLVRQVACNLLVGPVWTLARKLGLFA